LRVALDPRGHVELTGALTDDEGASVRALTATLATGEPGRWGYTIRLPLADLRIGSYVLTLEARAGRRTASRQIALAVE
jgi:hypothetical protein